MYKNLLPVEVETINKAVNDLRSVRVLHINTAADQETYLALKPFDIKYHIE
ncbi:MAG: hypothetical protein QME63_09680 [Actinomycetota bacterium]|nr:hypothetical protein [Actinomycetota bacterium]